MSNKKLQKIIQIENEDYEVQAVYSDEAGFVTHKLTLEPSFGDRTDLTDTDRDIQGGQFDGSVDKTVKYVPSDGGKFTGPVLLDNGYANLEDIPPQAITNFEQITARVNGLTGSPCFTWDGSELTPVLKDAVDATLGEKAYAKINTVVGTSSDLIWFKRFMQLASDGLSFSTTNGGTQAEVSAYNGGDLSVAVPEYTNSSGQKLPVTSVATSAFRENMLIRSVSLPNTVTTLAGSAFESCENLRTVILSNRITNINGGTFKGCKNLTSIIIPEGVTAISESAFNGCASLESLVIPKSLRSIGNAAFKGCDSLKTIYYSGDANSWATLQQATSGSSSNTAFTNIISYTSYEYDQESIIDTEFRKDPFFYVCKDTETNTAPASNEIFIKLPNEDSLIEVSKGADRLNSTSSVSYYTYEGLAEIIARINTRLDALGGEELKITTTAFAPLHDVEEINSLITDEAKKETLDTATIPTVQDLQSAIQKISGCDLAAANGKSWVDTFNKFTNEGKTDDAKNLYAEDSLKALRDDLTDLAKEVEYALDEDSTSTANQATRIDKLITGDTPAGQAKKLVNSADAGSDDTPIYFSNGVPKACTGVGVGRLKGKTPTKQVGGIYTSSAITANSLEELFAKMFGISLSGAPTAGSFTFSLNKYSDTLDLTTTSYSLTADWSINDTDTIYKGSYTPTIGGTTGTAVTKGENASCSGSVSFNLSISPEDTSKTITGSVAYNAVEGSFTAGTLTASNRSFTINRNWRWGPMNDLKTEANTSKNTTLDYTKAVDGQYLIIRYPKAWGKLNGIWNEKTSQEMLGAAFSKDPQIVDYSGKAVDSGVNTNYYYYEYRSFNAQNLTDGFKLTLS